MSEGTETLAPISPTRPLAASLARGAVLALGKWLLLAVVLIVLPLVLPGNSAINTFCYLGIMAIFALSYNVLLGQAGLLSLGHGMFFGFGGFFTVLAFNTCADNGIDIPLPLMPLFGALGAGL